METGREAFDAFAMAIEQARNAFTDLDSTRAGYNRLLGFVAVSEWHRDHEPDHEIERSLHSLADAGLLSWAVDSDSRIRIRFGVRRSIETRMELMTSDDLRAVVKAAEDESQ